MSIMQLGNFSTYYEVKGKGTPVLLIHGLGSSTEDWEYQVPEFSKTHKVISYDVRGHGRSSKSPPPYGIDLFAKDVSALIRHLDLGPMHVVGISMGGMIGLELALDFPAMVRSLTICNAGPSLRLEGLRAKFMLGTRLVIMHMLGMKAVGKKLAREMFPKPSQVDLRQKVQTRWARNDIKCYEAAIRAIVAWNVEDRLGELKCPVLIVKGEGDKTPSEITDDHMSRMLDARKVVIADSLHATPVDQADAFNEKVLDFITHVDKR